MAHKKFGGWFWNRMVFAQVKVADSLWYDTKQGKHNEKIVHLFRVGWYESAGLEDYGSRLYTVTILWLSVQFGFKKGK